MTKRMSAISLFSGCGGFDLGAMRAGLEIVWANDVDPFAAAVYRKMLPQTRFVEGDVRKVVRFPKADVLIGCYPCTGFSLGSRRRWQARKLRNLRRQKGNYLYREFVRALRSVQPRYFFIENVRGLVSADAGWFLERQLATFKREGYRVEWKVVDAADYGVPQSRKRLFIVGVRADSKLSAYTFPEAGRRQASLRDAIDGMPRWPVGEYWDYQFHGHYLTRNRKRAWGEPSFTIVADAHHVPLHPMGLPMEFVRKDRWRVQGTSNRRLSWLECAALQGLPVRPFNAAIAAMDDRTPAGKLRVLYRIVGNAVPPELARALVAPIVRAEKRGRGHVRSVSR